MHDAKIQTLIDLGRHTHSLVDSSKAELHHVWQDWIK